MADLSYMRSLGGPMGEIYESLAFCNNIKTKDFELLNEVYFGKERVKGIEKIMTRIEAMIRADPMVDIEMSPEGKALDAEIVKVFGFKSCHVYWTMDPGNGTWVGGPYTFVSSRIISEKTKNLAYGNFSNGVYDKDHVLVVLIQMGNALVTQAHMTGPELTAIILHEIGHNFDFTPNAILGTAVNLISVLDDFIRTHNPGYLVGLVLGVAKTNSDEFRKLMMDADNLCDIYSRMLPELRPFLYKTGLALHDLKKMITMIIFPIKMTIKLPILLMDMPIHWIANYFGRKSETYADSMAAAYGYGPEITRAMEKLLKRGTFENAPRKGVFAIFDNYFYLMQELMILILDEHTTNQQRCKHMIDSLRRDIDNPKLDKETRKACKKELARLEKTYNDVILMNDDERMVLRKWFQRIMDCWYKGTSPKYMNIFDPEHTYVQ